VETLVFGKSVLKGSQSVLFVRTLEYGPQQAHMYGQDESKGVLLMPLKGIRIDP
jgi:hypothetical protein